MQGKPVILLATSCRWFSAARLSLSFTRAGFAVEAVAPGRHPLMLTGVVRNTYAFNAFAPAVSIRQAIEKSQPDLVLPCDDLAAIYLRRLYGTAVSSPSKTSLQFIDLLTRSMGEPSSYPILASRGKFLAVAREEGINTPATEEVANVQQVRAWCALHSFPAVLKADGSSGGQGVRVVHTVDQALEAFRFLFAPVPVRVIAKRALVDRDLNLLAPWAKRRRHAVTIQKFVPGTDSNIAVACWKGEVIASVGAEVLETWRPKGPAAVIRLVREGEMLRIAQTITRRLKLSGLCGFDFLVDRETGRHTLIEVNPRATQTGHIPLGPGHDLASALYSAVTQGPRESLSVTSNEKIALFPLAWQSAATRAHLDSAFQDIPWEAPALVSAGEAETQLLSKGRWTRWMRSFVKAWGPAKAWGVSARPQPMQPGPRPELQYSSVLAGKQPAKDA